MLSTKINPMSLINPLQLFFIPFNWLKKQIVDEVKDNITLREIAYLQSHIAFLERRIMMQDMQIQSLTTSYRSQTNSGQLLLTANPPSHTQPSVVPPSQQHLDRIPKVRPIHARFREESS